ncbi:MAG: TRAP transporter small permease subunit [Candidatus Competibacterales bacterium]
MDNIPSLPRWLVRTSDLLSAFAEGTGRVVAWLTVILVLVTFAVVVMRYQFNRGSVALQESILYLHAAVFLLGAAYTLKRDGHVRVDIFYRAMGPRAKAAVDLLGTLLFLGPMAVFILWVSLPYVQDAWAITEGSREAGGLPYVYLLKTLLVIAPVLILLQGVALAARSSAILADPSLAPERGDNAISQEI